MAATELMSALSGPRVPTVKAALSDELADLVVDLLVKISPAARTETDKSALLSGERVVLLAEPEETAMFYVKNVPRWEQIVRVVAGIAMILCGLVGLQGLAIGYMIAGVGGVTLLTGFFGFCPMCALVGRRLDSKK